MTDEIELHYIADLQPGDVIVSNDPGSIVVKRGPETDLLGRPIETSQMWINAFRLVRPSDEFLLGLGRDVAQSIKVPGITNLRIAAT